MSRNSGWGRLPWALLPLLLASLAAVSCARHDNKLEEARVQQAFKECQDAIYLDQLDKASTYFTPSLNDYFLGLNSGGEHAVPVDLPTINLLVRRTLAEKIPADRRSHLTLVEVAQMLIEHRVFNNHAMGELTIGNIAIKGDKASAAFYYQNTLTPVTLQFVKTDVRWKIDAMAVLPYVEILLKVDRTFHGKTQEEQVEQLVNQLPML